MKYIVTGAAGFIGSHITDALIDGGHEVIAIDNLATGKKENINPRADFHKWDISDYKSTEPLFNGVDGVFHLAALARIQPSFENPSSYFQSNVIGTFNVLAAAKQHKVKRVVYSASSSAYGERDDMPLLESDKLTAQSLHPYGSTKRMGEMLMKDFGTATGGPETVCLRYFNVYGPRQTSTLDGPYATVIGIFCYLFKQNKPLTIIPDGSQRRDFTWVGDVVRANITAMASDKVGDGEIINIGTSISYSMWDVARLVLGADSSIIPEELINSKKCVLINPRKGEVQETLADIKKAHELLNWHPTMKLEDGIRQCLLDNSGNLAQSSSVDKL